MVMHLHHLRDATVTVDIPRGTEPGLGAVYRSVHVVVNVTVEGYFDAAGTYQLTGELTCAARNELKRLAEGRDLGVVG